VRSCVRKVAETKAVAFMCKHGGAPKQSEQGVRCGSTSCPATAGAILSLITQTLKRGQKCGCTRSHNEHGVPTPQDCHDDCLTRDSSKASRWHDHDATVRQTQHERRVHQEYSAFRVWVLHRPLHDKPEADRRVVLRRGSRELSTTGEETMSREAMKLALEALERGEAAHGITGEQK